MRRKGGKTMTGFEVAQVVAITVICYLIGMACKAAAKVKDECIPVIVGATGAILGIVGMYTMPDYPAHDILNAIAIGIVSGLAATGINQAMKQMKKVA